MSALAALLAARRWPRTAGRAPLAAHRWPRATIAA